MRPRESSFPTNVTNTLLAPCSGLNPSGLPEESCWLSAISSFACACAPPGDNVVLDENQGGDSKKKVSRCVCSVNIEPLYPLLESGRGKAYTGRSSDAAFPRFTSLLDDRSPRQKC